MARPVGLVPGVRRALAADQLVRERAHDREGRRHDRHDLSERLPGILEDAELFEHLGLCHLYTSDAADE